LEGELRLLRGHGAYTPLSLYIGKKGGGHENAAALLDLSEEAAILYDGNDFLEFVLLELSGMMSN